MAAYGNLMKNFDWSKFGAETTQEQMGKIEAPTAKFFLAHTKKELFKGALKHGVQLYPVSTPADMLETLHPAATADPAIGAPYPAAITIGVADPAATAACLQANGVAFDRQGDGSMTVAAEHATGVWLEFAPA